ncbi:MAG TPA: cation diffusion facilitator family transporter [Steroidobacteraceae bacterium]|nr:cation diffusion facilitator family transporter [Steroidobacteraceae bacterium]
MRHEPSSRQSVTAALIGNLLVAATKIMAAVWTGSSAMTSEAVHSLVDSGNEILLLYGQHRAAKRPDAAHPLGHGRELYFWSFIVALLVFAVGSGVSLYQGIVQIRELHPIQDVRVSYIVLALAFIFEGASWLVAVRQFRTMRRRGADSLFESFRRSKDPPAFMVLFEDSAALLGVLIAALGTYMAASLQMPVFDGIASILIGLVLGAIAILLARESKSLLIGETASHELSESIRSIAARDPAVSRVNGLLSAQLAPDQILVALSLEFADELRVPQIEEHVLQIEQNIRARHREVVALFIKPQTPHAFTEARKRRFGGEFPADSAL